MTVEKLRRKLDENFESEINTRIVESNNEKLLMVKWNVNPYNSHLNKIRKLKSDLSSQYVQVDPDDNTLDMITSDSLPIQYYKIK